MTEPELAAIEARQAALCLRSLPAAWEEVVADIPALLAEVRRLQTQVHSAYAYAATIRDFVRTVA